MAAVADTDMKHETSQKEQRSYGETNGRAKPAGAVRGLRSAAGPRRVGKMRMIRPSVMAMRN